MVTKLPRSLENEAQFRFVSTFGLSNLEFEENEYICMSELDHLVQKSSLFFSSKCFPHHS